MCTISTPVGDLYPRSWMEERYPTYGKICITFLDATKPLSINLIPKDDFPRRWWTSQCFNTDLLGQSTFLLICANSIVMIPCSDVTKSVNVQLQNGHLGTFIPLQKYSRVGSIMQFVAVCIIHSIRGVDWSHRTLGQFSYRYLRDQCTCSTCYHPVTLQRLVDTLSVIRLPWCSVTFTCRYQ